MIGFRIYESLSLQNFRDPFLLLFLHFRKFNYELKSGYLTDIPVDLFQKIFFQILFLKIKIGNNHADRH